MTDAAKQKEFELKLDKFVEQVHIKSDSLLKKVAFAVFTGIVEKTPVLTGRARSLWVIGIGAPAPGKHVGFNFNDLEGNKFKILSPEQAIYVARHQIAKLVAVDPFGRVVISNYQEYIHKLEDGQSDQAPDGMVGLTLQEVRAKLNAGIFR